MSNRWISVRELLEIFVLIVALLFGSVVTAGPASAWRGEGVIGQPGGVTLPQVSVSDLGQVPTLTFHSDFGPIVQRSPAAGGAQNVVVNYLVQRRQGEGWNGWVTVAHQNFVRQIGAGESQVQFPAVLIQPVTGSDLYRVSFDVHWATAGAPTYLGSQNFVPNSLTDHACVTRLRPCTVYAEYVDVGAVK